jgi:Uma2 family endonuclease
MPFAPGRHPVSRGPETPAAVHPAIKIATVTIVVVGEHPEFAALVERRRTLGLDGHDEVWEGVYHVAPYAHARHGRIQQRLARVLEPYADAAGYEVVGSFNLGQHDDYRVPDLAVRGFDSDDGYVPTAALVVEVLSPGDESYAKFDFYARRNVGEILIADPEACVVLLWTLTSAGYREVEASVLLNVTADELTMSMNWA